MCIIDWTLPSDHAALHFTSIFERPHVANTVTCRRGFKAINIDCFKDKVLTEFSELGNSEKASSDNAKLYNSICQVYYMIWLH